MRRRSLPEVEESLTGLAEQGVTDAPTKAPGPEAHKGLLDLALFVAEHRKQVSFPGFTWDDPRFVVHDAKVTFQVAYATLRGTLGETLEANLDRVRDRRTILAIDAHTTDAREFELAHELYGRITLFTWPKKPQEPSDLRIWNAVDQGWSATLKEHNLLPGRGIVILDEDQGLLLRDEALRRLVAVLLLLPDGQTRLWWNPFADEADSELQFWLKWGPGTGPSSAWRETFYVEKDEP